MSSVKAAGIIILRELKSYIYEFWLNDSRFDNIDDNDIASVYDFYTAIEEANKHFNNCFSAAAIGIEFMSSYDENILNMVNKSKNITSWMINESAGVDAVGGGYIKAKRENGFNIFVKQEGTEYERACCSCS